MDIPADKEKSRWPKPLLFLYSVVINWDKLDI